MMKLFLPLVLASISFNIFAQSTADYRVGSVWGKKRVTSTVLASASPAFARAALATAYLPIGGTGFYIGKFAGKHVIATNHHVCPIERDCVGDYAEFRFLKKEFRMTKLFITLPDVDLSLVEIDVPGKDEAMLARVARNFSLKSDIKKGTKLLTIGFGIGGNQDNDMMANMDDDCRVFSKDAEYKHLADPDRINPGTYKAWSFAHACDISHGDSGSAMVDRESGDVVGIVWTGKIPKSAVAQNSQSLINMYNTSSPAIWKELSFAVPAVKIGEYLRKYSQDSRVDVETREVLKAITK